MENLLIIIFIIVYIIVFIIKVKQQTFGFTDSFSNSSQLSSRERNYLHYAYHFIRFTRYGDDSIEDYIKAFSKYMSDNFEISISGKAVKMAVKYLSEKISVEKYVAKTKNIPHIERIRILSLLFDIAASDYRISIKELAYLESVHKLLQVSPTIFLKVKKRYIKEEEEKSKFTESNSSFQRKSLLSEAFQILEVAEESDFETIKKSYRKLVKENHPDKVATEGEEAMEKAEEKFRLIAEAYEYIKTSKGFK